MNMENPTNIDPKEIRKFNDKLLIESGMDMTNIYIPGVDGKLSAENVKPGTYNENQGVIIANIEGKIIAIPSNEKTSEWLSGSDLMLDESIGIPNLNQKETWGDQAGPIKEWLEVHQKFSR